uniref:Uncharacterized protein n=1 Tax=Aplanochytrium stocchinoi TaxID=215587 RepID=A0A7S3PKW4_9STRA|mmetsp:Transcript_733/g.906  ORF Transcript_733/g.906 Transcript_733/m.906 type:complete len:108 (+) Transcript_733:207-530(+)|eukprot:CAMPEP_0204830314 /NCGR_PEP_ID=MMETSP1346-20131115/8463_1 /ASSEMBLY_ACC=CAM_ASM_000771 /TAXON_ID=215587 /ORGANISM="Aplanochytrium stocchinoi, Strain GSBS06" /LENGTH=107 /DNA_ID=CAMNT_0051960489 /DNA_START=89 /DNA_END=412 /DNA_ORIENTATION=+
MVFQGQDAWRKHPFIANQWKNAFPGLKPAVAIFSVYCVAEFVYKKATAPKPFDASTLTWEKEGVGEKPTVQGTEGMHLHGNQHHHGGMRIYSWTKAGVGEKPELEHH